MTYKNEILSRQLLHKSLWSLRVFIKTGLLRARLRNISFCKNCGIDVRDFSVTDDNWERIHKISGDKNVLCYNCYCDFKYLSRHK